MRDVQLYSADQFFIGRFSRDGIVAKRYDRLSKLLPDVPTICNRAFGNHDIICQ